MDVSFQQSPLLGRLEVRPGCTVSPRNLGGNNPTLNLEAGKDYFVQKTGLSLGDRRSFCVGLIGNPVGPYCTQRPIEQKRVVIPMWAP